LSDPRVRNWKGNESPLIDDAKVETDTK